jgi:hypothetical protein
MKKKLFYVVDKELQGIDGFEEATGFKTISLYSAHDSDISPIGVINDVANEDSTKEAIQEYLDDNGMGDEEYEFKQL